MVSSEGVSSAEDAYGAHPSAYLAAGCPGAFASPIHPSRTKSSNKRPSTPAPTAHRGPGPHAPAQGQVGMRHMVGPQSGLAEWGKAPSLAPTARAPATG